MAYKKIGLLSLLAILLLNVSAVKSDVVSDFIQVKKSPGACSSWCNDNAVAKNADIACGFCHQLCEDMAAPEHKKGAGRVSENARLASRMISQCKKSYGKPEQQKAAIARLEKLVQNEQCKKILMMYFKPKGATGIVQLNRELGHFVDDVIIKKTTMNAKDWNKWAELMRKVDKSVKEIVKLVGNPAIKKDFECVKDLVGILVWSHRSHYFYSLQGIASTYGARAIQLIKHHNEIELVPSYIHFSIESIVAQLKLEAKKILSDKEFQNYFK